MTRIITLAFLVLAMMLGRLNAQDVRSGFFRFSITDALKLSDALETDKSMEMELFKKRLRKIVCGPAYHNGPLSDRDLIVYLRENLVVQTASAGLYQGSVLVHPGDMTTYVIEREPRVGEAVFMLRTKIPPMITGGQASALKNLLSKSYGDKPPREITDLIQGLSSEQEMLTPIFLGTDGMLVSASW